MRFAVLCAAIPWFANACAADSKPQPEPPPMSVKLMTPMQLPESRYRVVADITNFDPSAGLHGSLTILDGSGQKQYPIDTVPTARIQIDTDPLTPIRDHTAMLALLPSSHGNSIQDDVRWMTGPPDITSVTATVGDAGTIELIGSILGMPSAMMLGIRTTPDGAETLHQMVSFTKTDDTHCQAIVPVVLSTGDPSIFPGKVPPSKVYLRYASFAGHTDAPAGTTQLAYRISKPTPTSGAAGSTFEVTLFHPAHAPDLAGVTVSFDDTALTPDSVTELGDITAGGFIYLTRSTFKVPANATLGVHHVTATTSFGDVMLSNGPDFMVTAPVK